MRVFYFAAALLLLPVSAGAQVFPLRFSSPVGEYKPTAEAPVDKPGVSLFEAAKTRYTDRKTAIDKEKKYWSDQEEIQRQLIAGLSKHVNDSISAARDALDKQSAARTLSQDSYKKQLVLLDAKRTGIAARVAVYRERQAYCRYQRHNVKRLTPFPVSNRRDTPLFFNSLSARPNAEFLSKALTVINPSTGKLSLYNELYGDYVGWWRMGFGTTLVGSNSGGATTPEEQKNEAAIQRLLGGGGNFLVSAALPLAYFHTDDDVIAFKLTTTNSMAVDLPQANATNNDFAYHSNVSLDFSAYYQGFNKIITPFVYTRLGRVWGNSIFYSNLGRTDSSGMLVGQIMGGLGISDVLQVAGTFYYGSAFIRDRFPFAIALTLQPKLSTGNKP